MSNRIENRLVKDKLQVISFALIAPGTRGENSYKFTFGIYFLAQSLTTFGKINTLSTGCVNRWLFKTPDIQSIMEFFLNFDKVVV